MTEQEYEAVAGEISVWGSECIIKTEYILEPEIAVAYHNETENYHQNHHYCSHTYCQDQFVVIAVSWNCFCALKK